MDGRRSAARLRSPAITIGTARSMRTTVRRVGTATAIATAAASSTILTARRAAAARTPVHRPGVALPVDGRRSAARLRSPAITIGTARSMRTTVRRVGTATAIATAAASSTISTASQAAAARLDVQAPVGQAEAASPTSWPAGTVVKSFSKVRSSAEDSSLTPMSVLPLSCSPSVNGAREVQRLRDSRRSVENCSALPG